MAVIATLVADQYADITVDELHGIILDFRGNFRAESFVCGPGQAWRN